MKSIYINYQELEELRCWCLTELKDQEAMRRFGYFYGLRLEILLLRHINCRFFLNRFSVSYNLFCAFFLVTLCLVVAVQLAWGWIPVLKKSMCCRIWNNNKACCCYTLEDKGGQKLPSILGRCNKARKLDVDAPKLSRKTRTPIRIEFFC